MSDCGPRSAEGAWACETCGRAYPYPKRVRCPGKPPEPAVGDVDVSEQLARLRTCLACPECHQGDGMPPYCLRDRFTSAESVCELRARFQRRVRGVIPECGRG